MTSTLSVIRTILLPCCWMSKVLIHLRSRKRGKISTPKDGAHHRLQFLSIEILRIEISSKLPAWLHCSATVETNSAICLFFGWTQWVVRSNAFDFQTQETTKQLSVASVEELRSSELQKWRQSSNPRATEVVLLPALKLQLPAHKLQIPIPQLQLPSYAATWRFGWSPCSGRIQTSAVLRNRSSDSRVFQPSRWTVKPLLLLLFHKDSSVPGNHRLRPWQRHENNARRFDCLDAELDNSAFLKNSSDEHMDLRLTSNLQSAPTYSIIPRRSLPSPGWRR